VRLLREEASLSESSSSREPRSWRPLRRASLLLLALLAIGAPLVIGGVLPHVFVASALVGGVALLLALVGRRDRLPMSALGWTLLGGALLAALCSIPLPAGLVAQISPRVLPLTTLPGDAAPLRVALSLDVPATLLGSARMWGLLTVLLAAACLAARPDQARWLARIVAISGIVVTLVAIFHFAFGLTELYGFIPHKFEARAFTSFIDANHAASLGILSTLACLGLSVGRTDNLERWAWWVGAALCIGMSISTQSIAGLTMLACALGGFIVLQLRRKLGLTGAAALMQPLLVGLGVVLVLVTLLVVGVLVTDSLDYVKLKAAGKVAPWLTVLELSKQFRWVGIGAGAFSSTFESFLPPGHLTTITHPENFVLQWIAEWGVPATVLALLAFGWTFWKAFRVPADADDRMGGIHDAFLVATLAVLLHDLADMGLEFQGVGIPFVIALGVLIARSGRPRARRWTGALVGLGAMAAAVIAARVGMPRLIDVQTQQAQIDVFGKKSNQIADIYLNIMRLHPTDALLPVFGARALAIHATGPVGPTERKRSLALSMAFLDRSITLTQNDGPYLTRAWVYGQLGRRAAAMGALREAFRRGRDWENAAKLALSLGMTPTELAALPPVLKDIAPGPKDTVDLVSMATSRLLNQISPQALRKSVADAVLAQVDDHKIPQTATVLADACRALADDAFCSRSVTFGCDLPDDADEISSRALHLGSDWLHREPWEAGAYQCASRAYWSFSAAEERTRTLAIGTARLPDDLVLRGSFAVALVDSGQPAAALDTVSGLVPENYEANIAELIYVARTRALWALGKHGKALRQVDDAVRLNPDSFWAYTLAIRYHEFARQYDQALSLLELAWRFSPRSANAGLNDWRSQLRRERSEDAADPEAIERKTVAMDQPAGSDNTGTSASGSATTGAGRGRSRYRFMDVEVQLLRLRL
jgi:tetratricopeptide (TPR) repeat protein/O-antigen ligase